MTVDPQQLARTIRAALELLLLPEWEDGETEVDAARDALAALDALVGCLPPEPEQATQEADSGADRFARSEEISGHARAALVLVEEPRP